MQKKYKLNLNELKLIDNGLSYYLIEAYDNITFRRDSPVLKEYWENRVTEIETLIHKIQTLIDQGEP